MGKFGFLLLFILVEGIWPGLYDMMFWDQTFSTYATTIYGRMAWDYLYILLFLSCDTTLSFGTKTKYMVHN